LQEGLTCLISLRQRSVGILDLPYDFSFFVVASRCCRMQDYTGKRAIDYKPAIKTCGCVDDVICHVVTLFDYIHLLDNVTRRTKLCSL
jgi:hypothetical protein